MQQEILEPHPASRLRVYVIWFSMIPTDARSSWNWTGGVLHDSRVVHFWDEQRTVGRWFAEQDPENSDNGVVWDAYYLYGPDAEWGTTVGPLLSSGSTVRSESDNLKRNILPLLR